MSKLEFLLGRLTTRLWIWPALMSAAVVLWVWISYEVGVLAEGREWIFIEVSRETLLNLFTILASTMLTVATFSVSAIANAYASVATTASPRATRIVMQDGNVRSTLGAFLATFIYAVVAITALSAFEFGALGRFLLFLAFVVQVGWVLVSFLNWVDRISRLGRLGDTIGRVVEAGRRAFGNGDLCGNFGGRAAESADEVEGDAWVIRDTRFGYVQHLDMEALQRLGDELEADVVLTVRPGVLVTAGSPVARLIGGSVKGGDGSAEKVGDRVLAAITVGPERSVETDPRFALILLAEIADRALSPGMNDPGTAIAVLPHQLELVHLWVERTRREAGEPREFTFARVWVPSISPSDLVLDAFPPIARDGAGMVEVGLRLQKALKALTLMGHEVLAEAARDYSGVALEMAEKRLLTEREMDAVKAVAPVSGET